ncbi:MAG: hypothetical protein OYH76_06480 [Defluviicoccus sp.]|nr:hypothetical protein [Defluviicoccus sp.]
MKRFVVLALAVLLPSLALAEDARRLRLEAGALVQAAEAADSGRERKKLLEEARSKLLEIRNRHPSKSTRLTLYLGGKRVVLTPEDLESKIVAAPLADLDVGKLREVLGRSLSPTAADENGWTDLHWAAALNLPELAKSLVGLLRGHGRAAAGRGERGDDVARVEAARGGLEPGDDPAQAVPRAGGVIELGEAADLVGIGLGVARPDGGGGLVGEGVQHRIPHQAEDVVDAVVLAPCHRLGPAVVTVAPEGQPGARPVPADAAGQVLPDPAGRRPAGARRQQLDRGVVGERACPSSTLRPIASASGSFTPPLTG